MKESKKMYRHSLIKKQHGNLFHTLVFSQVFCITVEPRYNEDLETMKITLLYQGKNKKKYKGLGPANIPSCKRVLLYPTSL